MAQANINEEIPYQEFRYEEPVQMDYQFTLNPPTTHNSGGAQQAEEKPSLEYQAIKDISDQLAVKLEKFQEQLVIISSSTKQPQV